MIVNRSRTSTSKCLSRHMLSIASEYIYRHQCAPRTQHDAPQKSSFPTPLKYIDVMKHFVTDSESAAERTINDCWKINGATTLSDDWVGRTRFQMLRTRAPAVYKWLSGRVTKVKRTVKDLMHHEIDSWEKETP